jgi:hypothetical protein
MPNPPAVPAPASPPPPAPANPPNRQSNRANRGVPSARFKNGYFYLTLTNEEPKTYREAMEGEDSVEWQDAAKREFDALIKNSTWDMVERPRDRHVLKGKWVFRIKLKEDGAIDKFKARWVIKGFLQLAGVEFGETYAPTPRYESLLVLLAIAALKNFKLFQLDITSAFLNGKIDKEIYMEQPEGFNDGTGRVCLLKKSLYGLKQAPRIWNSDIHNTLTSLSFKQCRTDPCVYVLNTNGKLLYLLVYVDDIVIAYTDDQQLDSVVKSLQQAYVVQVCGELKWILGQKVSNSEDSITISQDLYVKKMLEKYGMKDCTPVSTPAVEAAPSSEDAPVDLYEFRSIVGSLMHATNRTRPDLAFATNQVCRYMNNATTVHLTAVKRILRYLKGNSNAAIKFVKSNNPEEAKVKVVGYCDASWGNDNETARSISGSTFFIGSAPVSWFSRLQPITALSSTEAEYVSASTAATQATWLRMLLSELGFPQTEPTTIFVDNRPAISIAENPVHHARTKHINIKFHHVRDLIQDGALHLEWCPTADMVADIFTKPLNRIVFLRHANHLLSM